MRQTIVALMDRPLLGYVQLPEDHMAAFVRYKTFAVSQDRSHKEVLGVNLVNQQCCLKSKKKVMVF